MPGIERRSAEIGIQSGQKVAHPSVEATDPGKVWPLLILGIGVDLVEIHRVESLLSKFAGRAKSRLYTPGEISYCEASHRPGQSFAARFAAKEAFFKALGTGLAGGASWQDVEVLRDSAAPYLRLTGVTATILASRGIVRTHVSLSHTEVTACAFVILEDAGEAAL